MFITKGDDPVHSEQQTVRELRMRHAAYQVEQCKTGAHRNLNFQRLTALMFVVTERDPVLLSYDREPIHVERVRREVIAETLDPIASRS